MIEKYYTPTIEEFHVGFEFELAYSFTKNGVRQEDLFVEHTIEVNSDLELIQTQIKENLIRVKYLDRKDIESLGFEHDQTTKDGSYFYSGTFMSKSHWCLCLKNEVTNIDDINNNSGLSFGGRIKNKSELSKLLKQLGIK